MTMSRFRHVLALAILAHCAQSVVCAPAARETKRDARDSNVVTTFLTLTNSGTGQSGCCDTSHFKGPSSKRRKKIKVADKGTMKMYECRKACSSTAGCEAFEFKTRGKKTSCTAMLQPVTSVKAGCIAQCVAVVPFPTSADKAMHIETETAIPEGVDEKDVVAVINNFENSIAYLIPGAEATFLATGNEVGAFRTFFHSIPGTIITEVLESKTDTGHSYSMVEGTTFKTLMLKSYTATMSVEDGKYKVVADIVFSDQGETNVLYSDYAGAVATYTAFYEGFMANIANVINAKKTGGLAAQKSMCESIQLSPEPTAMKAEFSKESGAYSGQAASLGHVDYGYLSQFLNSKSKVYALGEPINYNSAAFGVRQYLPDVEILGDTDGADNGFGGIIFGDEQVCYNPGVSTQIDGLTHFGYKDRFFDGQFTKADIYEEKTVTQKQAGAANIYGYLPQNISIKFMKNLGINTVPPMVSRALILDMLSYKGAQNPDLVRTVKGNKMLKAGVSITGDDVEGVLKEYGLEIVEGDAVFIYTGYQHLQWTDTVDFMDGEPGFDYSACEYLAEKKVWTVGADTWGTEVLLPTDANKLASLPTSEHAAGPGHKMKDGHINHIYPCHSKLLYEEGIFNLENLDLHASVQDGIREGLFVLGAPKSPTPQAHINPLFIA